MKSSVKKVICLSALAAVGLSARGEANETVAEVLGPANVMGMRRTVGVQAGAQEIAICVPWLGLDEETVTLSMLVSDCGLGNNDKLKVYDKASNGYFVWTWNSAYKVWIPTMDSSGKFAPAADKYRVTRGTALWLTRADPGKSFLQLGSPTADTVSSTVDNKHSDGTKGTAAKPVYNLMFGPKNAAFNLSSLKLADGCANLDRVLFVTTGVTYEFRRRSDTWGYYGPDGSFTPSSEISIPANTAFWYLSAGGNPTFVW